MRLSELRAALDAAEAQFGAKSDVEVRVVDCAWTGETKAVSAVIADGLMVEDEDGRFNLLLGHYQMADAILIDISTAGYRPTGGK